MAVAHRTTGTGADVLFLHGWAGSGAYFAETIAHLDATRTRSTTVDFRGHGDTPDEGTDWSLDLIAHDTLDAMDDAAIERAVVVGFSMSGKFAQYLTCVAPERVRGQILVAGVPAGEIPLPGEMLEDWYRRAGDADLMVELIRGIAPGPLDESALARFGRDAAVVPRSVLEGTMSATITTSFGDRLAAMSTPTLVIGGTRDPLFTPDSLRAGMVDAIPGARLALLDCSHEIPLERPLELAALIEAFLAGLR